MKEVKVCCISVKFNDAFDEKTISIIKCELDKAIKSFQSMLKCVCAAYVKEILIVENIIVNNNLIANGSFNSMSRVLMLKYNKNINKFRNIIVHELCHSKFNIDLAVDNIDLWKKSINGLDPAIYLINEYTACKYANKYCYDIEELKKFNDCKDNFAYYYKERKVELGALKFLASYISMLIISDDILKSKKINRKRIYIKDVDDIKKQLDKIEFIPSQEQYISLVELLKKKEYKAYT